MRALRALPGGRLGAHDATFIPFRGLTVPRSPTRARIDPYYQLVDWNVDNNIQNVKIAN